MFHLRGFSPPWWLAPSKSRGSIAPRNRSWGSPCFRSPSAPDRERSDASNVHPLQRGYPSESSLHRQPYRVTAADTFLTLPSNYTRALRGVTSSRAAPHERDRCVSLLLTVLPASKDSSSMLLFTASRRPPHRQSVNRPTPGGPPLPFLQHRARSPDLL